MILLNKKQVTGDLFPNNEISLDVTKDMLSENNQTIKLIYEDDRDLMKLMFLTYHLKDILGQDARISLKLPYVPYSRSDRPMLNRTFTLKALCDFINNLHFHKVTVYEPHSDVTVMGLKNIVVKNTTLLIALMSIMKTYPNAPQDIYDRKSFLEFMKANDIWFICPDNGAEKRYTQQILEIDSRFNNIRVCSKERELATGRIKRFMLADALESDNVKHAIIIDDLCSKGGTFILCAKALREKYSMLERVDLCVTHCEKNIFNGDIPSTELIQKVFVSDSMPLPNTSSSAKIETCFVESYL